MAIELEASEGLRRTEERASLDFKRQQYRFLGASDEDKSKILKDMLAFANTPCDCSAYMLTGMEEVKGGCSKVFGIETHLEDAKLRQC